jgi:hypothetical protein
VDPNLFHSYNSDFNCRAGLNIWLTGSRVIHSTSTTPVGPYTPVQTSSGVEVAVAAEAHNPQAIRAPDGTYILMDSYNGPDAGCPCQANYTTCSSVGKSCPSKMPRQGGLGWGIFHTSSTPRGPWLPINVSIDYPCNSENLTPSPFFHPNGTMFIVFHCDSDNTHVMCDLTMVRSASGGYRGPFVRVNDRVWDHGHTSPHPEDPFFWIRTSPTGEYSFHIILHNEPRGIHLFSRDGLNFTLQQGLNSNGIPDGPFVYNETVLQTDGSHFNAGRRERPWILFEKEWPNTRPVLLVTSM